MQRFPRRRSEPTAAGPTTEIELATVWRRRTAEQTDSPCRPTMRPARPMARSGAPGQHATIAMRATTQPHQAPLRTSNATSERTHVAGDHHARSRTTAKISAARLRVAPGSHPAPTTQILRANVQFVRPPGPMPVSTTAASLTTGTNSVSRTAVCVSAGPMLVTTTGSPALTTATPLSHKPRSQSPAPATVTRSPVSVTSLAKAVTETTSTVTTIETGRTMSTIPRFGRRILRLAVRDTAAASPRLSA